jgi:sigma-B regulation protein RsbU (phosphoserine phosphatase)
MAWNSSEGSSRAGGSVVEYRAWVQTLLSRIPVRWTVPLLLTLPVLVIAVVLSAIGYMHGRESAGRLASEAMSQVHERISERVTSLLDMPPRLGRINRGLIGQRRMDVVDLRSWAPELHEQTSAFPELSGVEVGFVDGRCVWLFRYPGTGYEFGIRDEQTNGEMHEYPVDAEGRVGAERIGAYPYDPRVRPWYLTGAESDVPRFGRPYGWVNKDGSVTTLGLPHATPVRTASGELEAVIGVEVSLEDMSTFLESLAIAKSGMAMIVDAQDTLIASSTRARIADDDVQPIAAASSEEERIAAISAGVAERIGSWELIRGPRELRLEVDGQTHLLMLSPIQRGASLQWFVATLVPEDDFLAGVREGRNRSIVVAGLAIVGTIIFGVLLSLLLVRPVLRMVQYARSVGEGDLDARIDLRLSPELVQLSDELNAMTAGLRDRMQLKQSLALAMEVQQSLLPTEAPNVDGLDLAGHSLYCDETGGDYFDFLEVTGLSERMASVVVGDVMGHGIAAALLMATARGVLRSRCQLPGSLADLLQHLNELLIEVTQGERFMTMLLMAIDVERRQMRWASAGHGYPFIFDREAEAFVALEPGGLPLGVLDDAAYGESVIEDLAPGQILLAPTDGVWEAQNEQGELYGLDRLAACIARHADGSAQNIVDAIREDVRIFQGAEKQNDDVTMVVVKIL